MMTPDEERLLRVARVAVATIPTITGDDLRLVLQMVGFASAFDLSPLDTLTDAQIGLQVRWFWWFNIDLPRAAAATIAAIRAGPP